MANEDLRVQQSSISRRGRQGWWRAAAGVPRIDLLVVCATLILGASGCGGVPKGGPAPSGGLVQTNAGTARHFGDGANKVWLITPRHGSPRNVVVFIHGWTATSPLDWHQSWLNHLVANGSAVLFPAYQAGRSDDTFTGTPSALRAGLTSGFRALDRRALPVIAAGYSVGGALAFVYAARASAWGLPRPIALFSVFPVDPTEVDPGLLGLAPPSLRLLILVGDHDEVVGDAGARAIWRWLGPVPANLKSYRLLHSKPKGLFFDHEALKRVRDPIVRMTFWRPLDRLIAASTPGR